MHGFIFCISKERECDFDFLSALDDSVGHDIDYYAPIELGTADEAITGSIIKPAKGVLEYEGQGVIRIASDPMPLAVEWVDNIRRQAERITPQSIGRFASTLMLEQAVCHPLGDDVRFISDGDGMSRSRMFLLDLLNSPIESRFYIHEIYDFHF